MSNDSTQRIAALRIIDAAANRATEGLRVVEDFTRFVLADAHLTRLVKELRHDLAETVQTFPLADRHALRDTRHDVGTTISTPGEISRTDPWDVCQASCERVKQSLRSLEEFGKLFSTTTSSQLEAIRYRWYTLEKVFSLTQTNHLRLSGIKLCVLLDGQFPPESILQLIQAGIGMIQLRDKQLSDSQLLDRARQWGKIVHSSCPRGGEKCLVIVNDRADIAAAANADGVHLGQEDLDIQSAREILGPRKIIGRSTHSIAEARAAVLDGADYLGVGPTFPSRTKTFAEFPGLELLQQVATEISLPAFALGGITLENLPAVLATGIRRIAVSSALAHASDPSTAARAFCEALP